MDIHQLETIVLSNQDWDLFITALENAKPSTGKLKEALLQFRQKYKQS